MNSQMMCFKGMMCPTFTPFNNDKMCSINYGMIDRYCQFLKSKGMQCLMINGWTGEGMTMSCEERMKCADEWWKACQKYGMKMCMCIGGMPMAEMYRMCEQAEQMKCDSVMLMPDMCYGRWMCEEDMMMWMKDMCSHMPTRPCMYMYMPQMQCSRMDMMKFMCMMEKECPMFAGMCYCCMDSCSMDQMMMMRSMKPNMTHMMCCMMSMMGGMMDGMEAMCMPMMNLCPEMMCQMYDCMMNNKMSDAMMMREKMMKCWMDWMNNPTYTQMSPMMMMKMEWNKMNPQMSMGPMRMPKMTMQHMMW